MAQFDYAKSAATANRLIERFGKTLAIRKAGTNAGSGFEPTLTAPSFHKLVAVEEETTVKNEEGQSVRVKTWLVRILEGVVPEEDDQLMVTGADAFLLDPRDSQFTPDVIIGSVKPLQPGSVTVLYKVFSRV